MGKSIIPWNGIPRIRLGMRWNLQIIGETEMAPILAVYALKFVGMVTPRYGYAFHNTGSLGWSVDSPHKRSLMRGALPCRDLFFIFVLWNTYGRGHRPTCCSLRIGRASFGGRCHCADYTTGAASQDQCCKEKTHIFICEDEIRYVALAAIIWTTLLSWYFLYTLWRHQMVTGHRWIPRTKASDAELRCFL